MRRNRGLREETREKEEEEETKVVINTTLGFIGL
jgi:hypothetical protein